MTNSRVGFLLVFFLIIQIITPAFSKVSTPSCNSITFSNKQAFDNCINLPTLNAVLHYTYTNSILSMGFTAPPPDSTGWVAWALNPKSTGMSGAQTLIAYKAKSGHINVNTLNIVSYDNLNNGPISYNVTNLSAEESNGVILIFGTWVIPHGKMTVNTVWQVGPVVNGKPLVHDFMPANLGSTLKLTFVVSEPRRAPIGAPTMSIAGGPSPVPAGAPTMFIDGPSPVPAGAPKSSPAEAPMGALQGQDSAQTPSYDPTTLSCKSITFSSKKTFDNCIDLPTLNAILHYTYNPIKSILSMGFTAPPPDSTGWVSWALNPKSTGMSGAQALIAYKPESGPINVNTLNIVSYSTLINGPISYNVTNLSAEASNGIISIFATWVIPRGEMSVNTIWQVGPVVNGEPGVHAFESENLNSILKLVFLVSGPSGAPVMSISRAPESSLIGQTSAPTPSVGGAHKSVVSVLMMVLSAIIVSLFWVY